MERKCKWICWEILWPNDPNEPDHGKRGKRVVINYVHPKHTADEAAEAAASELHDAEMKECGTGMEDYDGRTDVIEVETESGPKRFKVSCTVTPQYQAREIK